MLTTAQARSILRHALDEARKRALRPLTIVVLDGAGHTVVAEREDGASFFRLEIALGKAWASLAMDASGRLLAERARSTPWFYAALGSSSSHPFVPATGGVRILSDQLSVLGAVGVSGDGADEDESVAITGIHSVGFRSDPEEAVQ